MSDYIVTVNGLFVTGIGSNVSTEYPEANVFETLKEAKKWAVDVAALRNAHDAEVIENYGSDMQAVVYSLTRSTGQKGTRHIWMSIENYKGNVHGLDGLFVEYDLFARTWKGNVRQYAVIRFNIRSLEWTIDGEVVTAKQAVEKLKGYKGALVRNAQYRDSDYSYKLKVQLIREWARTMRKVTTKLKLSGSSVVIDIPTDCENCTRSGFPTTSKTKRVYGHDLCTECLEDIKAPSQAEFERACIGDGLVEMDELEHEHTNCIKMEDVANISLNGVYDIRFWLNRDGSHRVTIASGGLLASASADNHAFATVYALRSLQEMEDARLRREGLE